MTFNTTSPKGGCELRGYGMTRGVKGGDKNKRRSMTKEKEALLEVREARKDKGAMVDDD